MKIHARVLAALTLVLSLALFAPARADLDHDKVVEAGPEDGALCCDRSTFLFHGEKVLGTTGRAGIFRSEDRGERWQRSMEGFVGPNGVSGFVDNICQAPSEPGIVYALAGATNPAFSGFNGLFSSEDFGKTWTRRTALEALFPICTVDADNPRTVYISDFDSAQNWISRDGGTTVQTFTVPECAAGADILARHGILFVAGDSGCKHVSTDGGVSFSALVEPLAFRSGLEVSPDGRVIFISTTDENFSPSGKFRSTDGGASYVAVSGLPNNGVLAFDPRNPSRIYASDGLLYVSTDGGLTFTLLSASRDPRFLGPIGVINVNRHGSVFVNTPGGPFRMDAGGRTFRSLLNGFRASAVNNLAFDAEAKLIVAVQNTRAIFQQIHGKTYRPIGRTLPRSPLGDSSVAAVAGSPSDENIILAATTNTAGGGLFRTEDGGRTWTAVPGTPRLLFNTRVAFPTGDRAYLVLPAPPAFQPGLYRSDDAGRSFARLSSLRLGAVAVDPNNPDVLYVGTFNAGGGLFKSTDGGQTLQNLGQPEFYSALVVDARDTRVIYAGEQFGQVIRSLDGGSTFTRASKGLAGEGVLGLAQDVRGTLFAWLRGGGLFASHDRAASWHVVDDGEALKRSGVEAGRASLVADPRRRGRVYLGNAGVIRIDADRHGGGDDDDDD
jgi:photosystem II stability/assembly factor-like uncharacterized protein